MQDYPNVNPILSQLTEHEVSLNGGSLLVMKGKMGVPILMLISDLQLVGSDWMQNMSSHLFSSTRTFISVGFEQD